MPSKSGRRPCTICGRWFTPDPRVGARQRTCARSTCKRELHRRADRAWHARTPDYDRDRRLRDRLSRAAAPAGQPPPPPAPGRGPLEGVPLRATQDEFGPKIMVLLEFVVRLLSRRVQDEIRQQVPEITREIRRLLPPLPQDETDRAGPAP